MLSDAEIIRRILAGQIDLYSTLLARYERSARAAVLIVILSAPRAKRSAMSARLRIRPP